MPARLVTAPHAGLDAVMEHVRRLAAAGHWVLFVTARHPAREILDRAGALATPPDRLFVADAVGGPAATAGLEARRAMSVAGPQLLELLQLRAEKKVWSHGEGRTHIVVHDLNGFARHNPPQAVEQMARYVLQ